MLTWDEEVKPHRPLPRPAPAAMDLRPPRHRHPLARPLDDGAPSSPAWPAGIPRAASVPPTSASSTARPTSTSWCRSSTSGPGKSTGHLRQPLDAAEVNMTPRHRALWKDPNGLTEDERRIVKRNLGFSSPPTRWPPTTSCWAPTATSRRPNAASSCCARRSKKPSHARLPVHRRVAGPGRRRDLQRLQRVPVHPRQGRVPDPVHRRDHGPDFKTGTPEADQTLLKSLIVFACLMEGLFFYVGFTQIRRWAARTR